MKYRENFDQLLDLRTMVAADLKAINDVVNKSLKDKESLILLLTNHLMSAGGKRLRPLLALSCAKLCGYSGTHHITIAAAIEFIHAATLLHDDVVDESSLRRGVPTSNSIWGNKTSILVGDYLLGQAFRWLVETESLRALEILSKTSTIIAEGEVMQLDNLNNVIISLDKYTEIIKSKTAELFAASCQVGAVIAGTSLSEEESLYSFGLNLGIAFQIIDDILDYCSNQNQLGKTIGNDFREGKMTLPTIIAYNAGTLEEQNFWRRTMLELDQQADDLKLAINLIEKHDAINKSINQAKIYTDLAYDAINIFTDCEIKSALLKLTKISLERLY